MKEEIELIVGLAQQSRHVVESMKRLRPRGLQLLHAPGALPLLLVVQIGKRSVSVRFF